MSTTIPAADRRQLLSIAYGHLGSLADAEDAVQEAMLRLAQTDRASIVNPAAWLTTVVTRLCIDKLRSARHRREVYVGEWLPEPLFHEPGPEQDAITHSRLSIGLLYLMEKLDPEQRAVFVLREVFEYPYQEIAAIVRKSEAACRQLMTRARAALERARSAAASSEAVDSSVVSRFIDAILREDAAEMLRILSPDAVMVADGGGKVKSILRPLHGADRITRFFLGVRRKGAWEQVRPAVVNSGSGVLTFRDGELTGVAAVEIENGLIRAIYAIGNPEKIGVRPPHSG